MGDGKDEKAILRAGVFATMPNPAARIPVTPVPDGGIRPGDDRTTRTC